MPGISGIISSSAPLNAPNQILRILEEVHALKGVNLVQRAFQSAHCVITNTLTGILTTTLNQPISDPARNTFLFLEGEIYNAEALLGYLSKPRDLSPCGILLALFLEHGADFVSLLDGDFNIVIYQKAEKRLIILNDRLSCKPLYYMEQGHSLLFGSEKKAILAIAEGSPAIDPIGLLQVFAHHFHVGDRTFVENVKRLPPASRLEYHEGRLSLTRYYLMRFRAPKSMLSTRSLIEAWSDHLKWATIRRLGGKERLIISLSGGLDSRAVACAIPREFRPISARTWGFKNSLEVMCATEIAKRLNIDHLHEEPMAVPLSEILPKVVWRTECGVIFSDCRSIANHPVMKEHADFVTGGWVGDLSSGAHIRPYLFLPGSHHQFLDRTYRWYLLTSKAWLHELFNEAFLCRYLPDLRDVFFTSFDPLEGETNLQLYDIWHIYQRMRMTFDTAPVDSHLFEQVEPFRDRDYMDFTLTLPTRLRFGQSLYKAMIYEIGPEIRDVPDANTNLKVGRTVAENSFETCITLGLKAGEKLLERSGLYRPKRHMTNTSEPIAMITRRDLELRRIIEEFVHSSYFDSSIFNGPGILSMLEKHYQGVTDYAYPLCHVATFAVGLPYFIYERPHHCPPEAEPMS